MSSADGLADLAAKFDELRALGEELEFPDAEDLPTLADIRAVEGALAVRFPQDVVGYYLAYGGGGLATHLLCEIERGHPLRRQAGTVYWETKSLRSELSLPAACAVIYANADEGGADVLIGIGSPDCHVAAALEDGTKDRIAPSLTAYVAGFLDAAISRRSRSTTVSPSSPPRYRSSRVLADDLKRSGHEVVTAKDGAILALTVRGQGIPDALCADLAGERQLKRITASGVHASPAFLDALQHVAALEELHLSRAGLADPSLGQLGMLPPLKVLDISHNTVTPNGIAGLGHQPTITWIDASGLTRVPLHLLHKYFAKAETFLVAGLPVDAKKPLGFPAGVRRLGLSGCPIDDDQAVVLRDLRNLEILEIDGTRLTSTTFTWLVRLKTLKSLVVDGKQAAAVMAAAKAAGRTDVEITQR